MRWLLAIAVAVLGCGAVLFGVYLLPSTDVMQSRLGTLAPLYITWGMIWITVAVTIGLAGFLVGTGLGVIRDGDQD